MVRGSKSARDASGVSFQKDFGVKTLCFATRGPDITRKIIRGLKNFPLRKKDCCR